jgi:hypothetical protein
MVMSFPSLSICKEQSKQQEHERPQSQLFTERKKEKGAKFSLKFSLLIMASRNSHGTVSIMHLYGRKKNWRTMDMNMASP